MYINIEKIKLLLKCNFMLIYYSFYVTYPITPLFLDDGYMSRGYLSSGVFVWGVYVLGVFFMGGICLGGICTGFFCPGGICPRIILYTCSEHHLTFSRNIDTWRQWLVGNIV